MRAIVRVHPYRGLSLVRCEPHKITYIVLIRATAEGSKAAAFSSDGSCWPVFCYASCSIWQFF